jgi:hypothetical protein
VHLLLAPLRFGAGKIDLVQHRNDLEAGIEREEQVRQGLRLDALRRIDDEDGPLAGGK